MINNKDIEAATRVLNREIEGLEALIGALDSNFSAAVDLLLSLNGRVVISGMGKSGHIARKIAATLASTGTPALFVHPGEASHGDLGMITKDDAAILLSNSGETAELNDIINYTRRFSIPLIGIARRKSSVLIESADIAFALPEIPEGSPVEAPTTSTTMMLAWGDALAMALLERRRFSTDEFRVFHPGGKLGSQFIKVEQLMKTGNDLPILKESALMSDALIVMTEKSLGCAVVLNDSNSPIGVITDGDLRRHMGSDLITRPVTEIMKENPVSIRPNALATEAIAAMNDRTITSLLVVGDSSEDSGKLVGIIHIHNLLSAGVS